MKKVLFGLFIASFAFLGCKKDAAPIEIYLDSSTTPIILNDDIVSFNQNESTFIIKAEAAKKLKFDLKENFSLRVGNETVITGTFWPPFLSSLPDGVFIWASENTLRLGYNDIKTGKVDTRNDTRLITALVIPEFRPEAWKKRWAGIVV